jgi:hypothetical protein
LTGAKQWERTHDQRSRSLQHPTWSCGACRERPRRVSAESKTAERFFDFFTANIRNRNTRRAYYKAACRFAEWCEGRGLRDLAGVKPLHVAA